MASSPANNRSDLNGRAVNGGAASTSPYLPQGVPEHLVHPGIGGFPGHSEYQLPPTQKPAPPAQGGQMYEMGPHFGAFPGHPPQALAFNGHMAQHDGNRLGLPGEDGDFPTRHQMMNSRLKTLIQTRQSQKEQGPFQGLETTLGPSVGGNFVHPQADTTAAASRGFPPLVRSNGGNGGCGTATSNNNGGNNGGGSGNNNNGTNNSTSNNNNNGSSGTSGGTNSNPRPLSSNEMPADAWHDASPSSGPPRGRSGIAELPEFAKNGSSSSSQGSNNNTNNNNSEAEFSQPEDQSHESEFAEGGATERGDGDRTGAPPNGMLSYRGFYGAQEAAEVRKGGEGKDPPTSTATTTSAGDVHGGGAQYQFTSAATSLSTTTTTSVAIHGKPCNGPTQPSFEERQSPRSGPFSGGPTSFASSPHLASVHQERPVPESPTQLRNEGSEVGSSGQTRGNESESTDATAVTSQQQPFLSNTTTSMNTYTSIISTYNSFAASCAPSFLAEHQQPKFGVSVEDAARTGGGDASDVDGGRIAVGEFRGLDFGAPPLPHPGGPEGPRPHYPQYQGAPSFVHEGPYAVPYGAGNLGNLGNPFPLPPMGAGGPPFAPMSLPGADPWWDRLDRLERLRSNAKAEPPACDCYGADETREYRTPRSPSLASSLPAAM